MRLLKGITIFIFIFLLTACAYPEEKQTELRTPYETEVEAVQAAVDQYREDHDGLLPIKNKDSDTPIYEKYPIDFNKLTPKYMAEPPINAFESGGVFQYVLIDVETSPTVKIFDLRIAETIRDINLRIKMEKYPPFKDKVADNVYTLDFSQLGFKEEPYAISPYSNEKLPFVITGNGVVFVDYTRDLYEYLQQKDVQLNPGEDIRHILVEDSLFVPAYSLPYTIEDGKPIFLAK